MLFAKKFVCRSYLYKRIYQMAIFATVYLPRKYSKDKSRLSEVFSEKGVLKDFAKFTGKHMCQSLFFIKVAGRLLQLY